MNDLEKLIVSICVLAFSIISFIAITIIINKRKKMKDDILNNIEAKTKEYFMNVKIENDGLFPFYEKHSAGIRYKISSKGDKDEITNIMLKKHYSFYQDKVMYIVNNNLHYPYEIVEKEEKKYIQLDSKIKTIEILVFTEKPSHFLLKYKIYKKEKGYTYEVKEETHNDRRRDESNENY